MKNMVSIQKADKAYEKCFGVGIRNALLAQEHFRWNAYHLLNGYLPMKKERIVVKFANKEDAKNKADKVKRIVKNEVLKKHACLTTFYGLAELSQFIAKEADKILPDEKYAAEDFEYYSNDALLMEIAPEFFKKKGYSVFENFDRKINYNVNIIDE